MGKKYNAEGSVDSLRVATVMQQANIHIMVIKKYERQQKHRLGTVSKNYWGLKAARKGAETIVVSSPDTDVLVLLLQHRGQMEADPLTGRTLPPTEDSFLLHVYPCIYQLMIWRNANSPIHDTGTMKLEYPCVDYC